jgi:hypothetical protein
VSEIAKDNKNFFNFFKKLFSEGKEPAQNPNPPGGYIPGKKIFLPGHSVLGGRSSVAELFSF